VLINIFESFDVKSIPNDKTRQIWLKKLPLKKAA